MQSELDLFLGAVGHAVRRSRRLRRLGWRRLHRLGAYRGPGELARLQDGKFYVIGANSLFQDNLPITS